MNCEKPYDLVAYLKGELPEAERSACRAHFESCASCLREVARFDSVLKALGRMEVLEPSPDFRWRVREAFVHAHPDFARRVHTDQIEVHPSFWASLRGNFAGLPAWSVSLAVHVVLLAIAAMIFLGPADPEEVDRKVAIRAKPKEAVRPGFPDRPAGGSGLGTLRPDQPPDYEPGLPPDVPRPTRKPTPGQRPFDPKPWERVLKPVKENPFLAFLPNRTTSKAGKAREAGAATSPAAVRKALAWLARNQSADGSWDAVALGGDPQYQIGLTGLATLAFLADGQSHLEGEHAAVVKRALLWLQQRQKMSGLVGEESGNYMYNHAIGSIALVEAAILSGDDALDFPVQLAVSFALKAQNAGGGWDYVAGGDNHDTSVSGWMVLLLRLALEDGNRAVIPALSLANERIQDKRDAEGRIGYRGRGQFPNGPYGLTAVGLTAYLLSTPVPDPGVLTQQSGLLVEGLKAHPPAGADRAQRDLYFLHFGSIALAQCGGVEWSEWNRSVAGPLESAQQADGSWARTYDRWSSHGGQVYTTAMASLVLSAPWRYPALLK